MTTKNAIVYARVSTDDQADKGFSLSAQIEAGRKYADALGMTVTQELIDDGVSGAMAFSERPAGATALALLRNGKAQALIVQNVDRLSRDVVDLLVTIRALLRAGVEVHCLDLGQVTSEYDIMLVIRGWQGSDERQKIKERSMRGKREKLAQGMVIAMRPPYGYDHLRDDRRRAVNFIVNEEQAAVVRLIYQWYTRGDGNRKTLTQRAIAVKLSEAGIETPSPAVGQRKKESHIWSASTIRHILLSETYKGVFVYRHNKGRGNEETFRIEVPAIVDAATWNAAQVQRERNQGKARRNAKHYDYLLSGLVTCGECGTKMYGASLRKCNSFYYRCAAMSRHYKGLEERVCCAKMIRAEVLEAAVWAALRDRLEHSDTLEGDLREAQRRENEEREPQLEELETVLAMMTEAQAEANNLAATFARLVEAQQDKGPVGSALKEKISAVNERHSRLAARQEVLEAELSNRRFTDELIQRQLEFTANLRAGIENAGNADKRRMLDTFKASVTVTDGKPVLTLWMPDEVIIELTPYW